MADPSILDKIQDLGKLQKDMGPNMSAYVPGPGKAAAARAADTVKNLKGNAFKAAIAGPAALMRNKVAGAKAVASKSNGMEQYTRGALTKGEGIHPGSAAGFEHSPSALLELNGTGYDSPSMARYTKALVAPDGPVNAIKPARLLDNVHDYRLGISDAARLLERRL